MMTTLNLHVEQFHTISVLMGILFLP